MTVGALTGCQQAPPPPPAPSRPIEYTRELPPGQKALRKLAPQDYPDFEHTPLDRDALVRSIDNSLRYLQTPSSSAYFPYLDITHERAIATLHALRDMTDTFVSPRQWNIAIRENYEVYQSVGALRPDGDGYTRMVLFTGYFTPIYEASRTRTSEYAWPLYARRKICRRPLREVSRHGPSRAGRSRGRGAGRSGTGLAEEPVGGVRGDRAGIGAAPDARRPHG